MHKGMAVNVYLVHGDQSVFQTSSLTSLFLLKIPENGVCVYFRDLLETFQVCPFVSAVDSTTFDSIAADRWNPSRYEHPSIARRTTPLLAQRDSSHRLHRF